MTKTLAEECKARVGTVAPDEKKQGDERWVEDGMLAA